MEVGTLTVLMGSPSQRDMDWSVGSSSGTWRQRLILLLELAIRRNLADSQVTNAHIWYILFWGLNSSKRASLLLKIKYDFYQKPIPPVPCVPQRCLISSLKLVRIWCDQRHLRRIDFTLFLSCNCVKFTCTHTWKLAPLAMWLDTSLSKHIPKVVQNSCRDHKKCETS